jgi:predicted nucleotidyltransferase component of viral defense system
MSYLKALLSDYTINNVNDAENALKEIVQHVALLALWRSKFFEHAAFYGGTALRMFYQLNRFSEDMDFSLITKNRQFDLKPYLESIEKECAACGLKMTSKYKEKTNKTFIESAFLKGNTLENMIAIELPEELTQSYHVGKQLKIKFEVDINPPPLAKYEVKTLLNPIPFQVKLYQPSSLFAGKCHALLCRKWKNRIKGRDFYDFLWYVGKKVPLDLKHLQARMIQSEHLKPSEVFSAKDFQKKLKERFAEVDYNLAKADVAPFIVDPDALNLWSESFFINFIKDVIILSE